MKTLTGTCNLCGTKNTSLIHDGRSFLICEDANACMARVRQMEQVEYEALQKDVANLKAQLNPKLKRLGQLEVSLGYYDLAVAANKAEIARIETEN